jgi:RNA-directed DNA polymerase
MVRETQTKKAGMPDTGSEGGRRNLPGSEAGASSATAKRDVFCPETEHLMEAAVERENMQRAYERVVGNKGSAGIDGMTVDELKPYLHKHWARIKAELLEGRYKPQPVLRVEIPKAGGGKRPLGIPAVVDRLIQQAVLQVLVPIFDPCFSESSFGFRPGRSAHQAVLKAREYVAGGKRWVVDLDIEKFFDRVNHDILMSRVARKVKDKRLLLLIRRYLQSGVMEGGVVSPSREGTPQGGPLSPLLSNILLDELDKELERRGHSFCRYADDCNIYVNSHRAGERIMASIARFLEKHLRLKLNEKKSKVVRPWETSFLGYSMTWDQNPRLKAAPYSVKRLKDKLKETFRRGKGRNLKWVIEDMTPLLRGWINYYSLCEVRRVFEELDGWIRHKYRCVIWRQWKRPYTRMKNLMKRGLSEERAAHSAFNGRGPWWNSGASHMNEVFPKLYFDKCGLISLLDQILVFQCRS